MRKKTAKNLKLIHSKAIKDKSGPKRRKGGKAFTNRKLDRQREKLKNIAVLLVDDEPVILEVLKQILADAGIVVVMTALNGAEALEAIRNSEIDVIITDVAMPVMDGTSLAQMVHDKYPLLMMSARCSEQMIEEIMDLNDAYIDKFRTADELVPALLKAIERWQWDELTLAA